MSEAVMDTVVGVLDGITEKPTGWTEITVQVDGLQYPVKMATKLQPLIELARAAGTDTMEWTYKKQDSEKINPNSGKPYVNRYFEGVVPVEGVSENRIPDAYITPPNATPSQPALPQTNSNEGMTSEKWDAKERRDYRSRAWAQTLAAFTHTIKVDEKPEDVFARLQPFQRKVFTDVCQSFAFPDDDNDVPF